MPNYQMPLDQLKQKILRIIDQDRNKAAALFQIIKTQINTHPEAMLLIGDKATQTLDNLRKHAGNLIRMYQIQKKKITPDDKPKDIDRMLKQIQEDQKRGRSGNK